MCECLNGDLLENSNMFRSVPIHKEERARPAPGERQKSLLQKHTRSATGSTTVDLTDYMDVSHRMILNDFFLIFVGSILWSYHHWNSSSRIYCCL